MTCQDFEPFLLTYVDGEFEGPEKADAEAHLASCEACRREVEAQRAYKRRMHQLAAARSALSPPAPAHLRASLTAALAREPAPGRRVRLLRPSVVVPALLAAAAAVAVVVWARGRTGSEANELVAAAIAHHQTDLPLDVQDAQLQHVREWLHGRVAFAPSSIPELRNAALRGARVSSLAGHPAVYVAYGRPGDGRPGTLVRVSLLVFDAPELRLPAGRRIADREVMLANQRGYNVAVWKDREIAYSLVAELDEQDIVELVAASNR